MTLINISNSAKKIEENLQKIREACSQPLIIDAFRKDFEYRFCWSSNALEGNTLTLSETIELIEFDRVNSNHTFSEYLEAKNLYGAVKKYMSFREKMITEEWVKDVNAYILDREAKYRDHDVFIGSEIHTIYYPPAHDDVEKLMRKYFEDISIEYDGIEKIIKKIAVKHIEFERIHPFPDGNGRTGRIILNQMLINNGLLPISIQKNSKYRNSFIQYDKNKDASLLEHIICKCELHEISLLEELVKKYNKVF